MGETTSGVNGNFQLDYGAGGYTRWEGGLNPNIRVRIYGPVKRILYDRTFKDVSVETLDLETIRIHSNNVGAQSPLNDSTRDASKAWLVTNATLNPENGEAVNLSEGNTFEPLIDGADLFTRVTDAVKDATSSINFMNLNFRIARNLEAMRAGDLLITKFDPGFQFRSPPLGQEVDGEMIQQIMIEKTFGEAPVSVRVIVADIALTTDDAPNQVDEFFQDFDVETRIADYGIEVLHARAVIVDGQTAFVIGSSFDQSYFSSPPHEIRDARHRGALLHDVAARITGPAVAPIDETFATVWNEADISDQIEPRSRFTGTGAAAMQVLRTMPGVLFHSPFPNADPIEHGETSILEAYQRAIARAEKFIYIEDQYFTNSAIVDALIMRMNEVLDLQLIMVLNINPDVFGYPRKQTKNIRRMQQKITDHQNRFRVFTLWSTQFSTEPDRAKKPFEIMNIDVHSKVAIIDDKWATIGTANLDGSGLNAIEISDVVKAALLELPVALLGGGTLFAILWVLLSFAVSVVLAGLILGALVLVVVGVRILTTEDNEEITSLLAEAIKTLRSNTQHANPFQEDQPARHVELNIVIYNAVGGLPATDTIKDLRKKLWAEHLGLLELPFPAEPAGGWLELWDLRAGAKLTNIKANAQLPPDQTGVTLSTTVLEWKPETTAKAYLKAHDLNVDDPEVRLTIREKADEFDFVEGQWKKNET